MTEWEELPLPICTCGQLGITPVDNPPASRAGDSTILFNDKAVEQAELVDALIDSVDLLTARIEALELQYASFLGILDRPLSPTESLEELKRLREALA